MARIKIWVAVLLFTVALISLNAQFSFPARYDRGQDVSPTFDGWESNPDGSYNFYFGYLNRNREEALDVPIGPENNFDLGNGDIEMEIGQKGTKLSGPWTYDFGDGEFTSKFKGSINGDGDIKMNLKAGKGGCHLSAVGQLVTEGEIEMTYRVKSCKGVSKHDFGSIQLFAAP